MIDYLTKSCKYALKAIDSIHKGKFGDAIICLNCAIREKEKGNDN